MSTELALTVLCDNHATEPLQAEHGLAFWLQGPELAALFDCGSGQTLCQNALQLQIPLASCQQVILSHGHYDHTGGLAELWRHGMTPPIVAHPDVTLTRYSCHPDRAVRAIGMPPTVADQLLALPPGLRLWRSASHRLAPYLGTSGEIPRHDEVEDVGGPFFLDADELVADLIQDDLALWINTPQGLVILLGCGHAGLINTIEQIRRVTGCQRIAGIIGGLHLLHASPVRIQHTLDFLRSCCLSFMYVGHCSGDEVIAKLGHELPGVIIQTLQVGERYVLPLQALQS
jgi:7,8-dihydropterin-6-yl-methyl-4-(beta-D-ribofuranosyl)aminobenzene 5'-phosphate synthase